MHRLGHSILLLATSAVLLATPQLCLGQQRQRGNFDPQQARERMMSRIREQFDVKDDSEWSAIEPRVQKVLDARRDVGGGGMGMMFGRGGRGRAGGATTQDDQAGQAPRTRRNAAQGDQGGGGRRGPQLSPAAQELRTALDNQASSEDIKTKLAAYREERKQKQAKLESAQDDLRKVLSVKQEAAAVLMGLLQ
jgi:hypothetical protein